MRVRGFWFEESICVGGWWWKLVVVMVCKFIVEVVVVKVLMFKDG